MNKIAVSDICDTLYFSNTTFDFIRFCVEMKYFNIKKRIKHGVLLNKKSPFFWLIVAAGRVLKKDFAKKIAVSLLGSSTVNEVKEWAYLFYDKQLAQKKINESFAFLETNSNIEWVLASSTLCPIAEVVAERTGINKFIATKLRINNESYTGKIAEDVTGKKYAYLKEIIYKEGFEIDLVITDNISDMDLVSNAKKTIVVCHNKKQFNFWKHLNDKSITIIRK